MYGVYGGGGGGGNGVRHSTPTNDLVVSVVEPGPRVAGLPPPVRAPALHRLGLCVHQGLNLTMGIVCGVIEIRVREEQGGSGWHDGDHGWRSERDWNTGKNPV